MSDRRICGQSSLEFLMTYGWAILVILIAFFIAWQWGLFSVGETVAPGSFGFWGVEPKDYILHRDGRFELSLINNLGANITILYYNVTMADTSATCVGSCVHTITPDKTETLTFSGLTAFTGGRRFEANVFIRYNDTRTGNTEHVSSGRIWGGVED